VRSTFGFVRAALGGGLATIAVLCGWAAPAEASLARQLGQPISAYSASLFGKTGLSSLQLQTLTCDPDEPLGGTTSATFDPSIVHIMGFGFGPGYLRGDDSPFASGFGIEVTDQLTPTGVALIDLGEFLETPGSFTPTGYLRAFFKISGEGVSQTGKLTDQFTFIGNHPDFIPLANDGPLGVDTHYYDFQYNEMDNSVEADYNVFADTSTTRYAFTPLGNTTYTLLPNDYVITQDAPGLKIYPGGDVPFASASVAGTTANVSVVPLPAAVWGGMALLGGMGGVKLLRRRRPADL
jgi:hypothetical protein